MEALYIFIAKSSGLLVMFYCAYYFLLRKETFFNSNRWYLLAGLITSVVLPFLVYTRIIWINPAPLQDLAYSSVYAHNIEKEAFEIHWNYILICIYSVVFLTLIIKFAIDFYSLNSVLKGKKIQQQADFKFIDVRENIAPFSYFDYIVYNSSMYSASELESIIEHEKVHSEQNHTVDVLLARFFCILFWFNPIIWFYKKAIVQNLEFIADKEAARKISDKKAYQYTLLKITTHENCLAITNHFYQSLIKKRIVMLNQNQSKKRNSWKYYVVLPILIAFVFLFQIEVIAKEKREIKKEITKDATNTIDLYKIRKTTTDQEIKEIAEKLKLKYNINLGVSDIKRNSENELIVIKVDIKNGSEENQVFSIEGNKGIKDCKIVIAANGDGSIRINLVTDKHKSSDKEHKTEVKQIKNSKTTTNVNTNSNTGTKINSAINNDSNIIVTASDNSNINTNVTVSSNSDTQSTFKINGNALYVVNGTAINNTNKAEIISHDSKTITIYNSPEATVQYGEARANGAVIIETKK